MSMRFFAIPGEVVPVTVMVIVGVTVAVAVCEHLVAVKVFVAFEDMQPDPYCHESGGRPEQGCGILMQESDRDDCADKRRQRKVCSGARRTDPAQCQNVESKTQAHNRLRRPGRRLRYDYDRAGHCP